MKKGYCRLLILTGVILALSGCGRENETKSKSAALEQAAVLKEKYSDSDKYIFQEEPIYINMNESITFPTKISKSADFEKNNQDDHTAEPFTVYEDCDLTRPLFRPDTISKKSSGYNFIISPSPQNIATESVSFSKGYNKKKETFTLLGDDSWGIYDTLYLVQNNDLNTGRLLEKPYIYLVKIDHSSVKMAAPKVKMSITDDGQLNLEWARVKRAEYYLVIQEQLSLKEENGYLEGPRFACLEIAKSEKAHISGYRLGASMEYSSDNKNDPAYKTDLELRDEVDAGVGDYHIFVVAVNKYKNLSVPGNSISSDAIGNKVPIGLAWNTFSNKYASIVSDGVKKIEDLPDRVPMIMADGSVSEYTVTYSIDESNTDLIYYQVDNTVFDKDWYYNLLPEIDDTYYSPKRKILQVSYNEDAVQGMESIKEQVIRTAGEVVNGNMDELEKVKAINRYLVETSDFDDDAFAKAEEYRKLRELDSSEESKKLSHDEWREMEDKRDTLKEELRERKQSFNMIGVLLHQKGTSDSYAEAFAALGTQAGLMCVCVTGETASGEAHTWNYVKINGEWRVADVAGNEMEGSGNTEKYLNLALNDPLYADAYSPDNQFLRK
ncbi:transglutaminase domain-containing protein [Muricomes intestini]|uniref:Transglutaminase-like domain-containing protein n=2 Tax=Muricomes intestini TaxID=1796634 RepID=A0A4V2URG4_9FIRM|nr:transglutaminase domain-containing protein [Muricomes intestini]TCS77302.1 hypothetical protein EDD59_11831 [Muricomes intestini]